MIHDLKTQHTTRAVHAPQVVVHGAAAPEAARLLGELTKSRDWTVRTERSLKGLARLERADAPDLIAAEYGPSTAHLEPLLRHAKHNWPQTFFLLYTTAPGTDASELLGRHGDMPVLSMPSPAELRDQIVAEVQGLSLGAIRGLALPGLLQMLHWEHKSVAVHVVAGARWGRLHLRRGQLVDAYLNAPETGGLAAALEVLAWDDTSVFLERSYHNGRVQITDALEQVLMRAMQRRDEAGRGGAPHLADDDTAALVVTGPPARDPPVPDAGPTPPAPPARAAPGPIFPKESPMSNANALLSTALETIDGAFAAVLVEYETGMALGTAGSGINLDMAAAGNTEVVRAKMRTMQGLGISGEIQDILITLDEQYHLMYFIPGQTIFMYLALHKDRANLGMARLKLKALGQKLEL